MPGIGSIHAQAVAMREGAASDRRRHDLGNWPERRFQPLIGELDGNRFTDRRQDHALAAALDEIAELSRAPILRALREANEENRRLRKLVTDYEELARKGFEMGQASRPLQTREAQ